MYCYTSCGYAKWFQKHSFLIVKDSKWGKNKRLLNLCTSLLNFLSRSYEMHDESDTSAHTHTSRPAFFQQRTNQLIHSSHTATSQSATTAQREPTQPEKLHWFTTSSLNAAYWQRFTETNQNSTQTVLYSSTGGNLLTNLSVNIHVIYLYRLSQNTHDCNTNHKVHLIFTGCLLTGVYSVDKILNKLHENSQVSSN